MRVVNGVTEEANIDWISSKEERVWDESPSFAINILYILFFE